MRIQFPFLMLAWLYSPVVFAQYVGIGVSNPTLGRLQVNGGIGRTTAIFGGDSIGISLQRNLPAIGYNQYDNNSPLVLGSGISLLQSLSTANGSMYFDFYNTNTGSNTAPRDYSGRMTIRNNGNVSLNTTEANTSLFVLNNYQSATAVSLKGTIHKSEFMKATTQTTTINGGLNLSDVYINDVATLEIYIWVTAAAKLELIGPIHKRLLILARLTTEV